MCFAIVLALAPARLAAKDDPARADARALAAEGVKAYEAGDYVAAEEKFSRAFSSWQAPSLAFWSARTRELLGKWVEAAARYQEAEHAAVRLGDEAVQRAAQTDAKRARAELLPRIPTLLVRIEGARPGDVLVRANGVALASDEIAEPIPMNPGEHVILAERSGERQLERVTLAEGEGRVLVLHFASHDPAHELSSTAATWRTAGWAAVGVGGATLIVSGVSALMASSKHDDLKTWCPENQCPRDVPQSVRDDKESYDSLRTLSTVTWIAGGIALASGVVVLVTRPGEPEEIGVGFGPGSFRLQGRF